MMEMLEMLEMMETGEGHAIEVRCKSVPECKTAGSDESMAETASAHSAMKASTRRRTVKASAKTAHSRIRRH